MWNYFVYRSKFLNQYFSLHYNTNLTKVQVHQLLQLSLTSQCLVSYVHAFSIDRRWATLRVVITLPPTPHHNHPPNLLPTNQRRENTASNHKHAWSISNVRTYCRYNVMVVWGSNAEHSFSFSSTTILLSNFIVIWFQRIFHLKVK